MWRIFWGLRSRGQPLTRVWGTVPKRQEEPRHIGSFATKPKEWEHRKITVNQSKPDIMSWGIWRVFLCREIPESVVEAVPLTRSWTLWGQYLGLLLAPVISSGARSEARSDCRLEDHSSLWRWHGACGPSSTHTESPVSELLMLPGKPGTSGATPGTSGEAPGASRATPGCGSGASHQADRRAVCVMFQTPSAALHRWNCI